MKKDQDIAKNMIEYYEEAINRLKGQGFTNTDPLIACYQDCIKGWKDLTHELQHMFA